MLYTLQPTFNQSNPLSPSSLVYSLLLFLVTFSGCTTRAAVPPAPLPIEQLLVAPSAYPAGWHAGAIWTDGSSSVLGGDPSLDYVAQQYESGLPHRIISTHKIWRYRSAQEASDEYAAKVHHTSGWAGPLARLDRTSDDSVMADHMTMFCGENEHPVLASEDYGRNDGRTVTFCVVVAQYDAYVSTFSSYIDNTYMTVTNFEQLLVVIDTQMQKVRPRKNP